MLRYRKELEVPEPYGLIAAQPPASDNIYYYVYKLGRWEYLGRFDTEEDARQFVRVHSAVGA